MRAKTLTPEMIHARLDYDAAAKTFRWKRFEYGGAIKRGRTKIGDIAGSRSGKLQIRLAGHRWSVSDMVRVLESGRPLVKLPRRKLVPYAGWDPTERLNW